MSIVPDTGSALSAKSALTLIHQEKAPDNLKVADAITFRGEGFTSLPVGLSAQSVVVQSKTVVALPDRMNARRIQVTNGTLERLGSEIACDRLDLSGTAISTLPDDLIVRQRLDLTGCQRLEKLPSGLVTGSLNVTECTALEALPDRLKVSFLNASGCTSLRRLPDDLQIEGGHLILRDCPWLTSLPSGLGPIAGLDVSGCLNLTRLPDDLEITSWIDFAGTAITGLPDRMETLGLRWHGIPVPRRVIFEPESLSVDAILQERNAELRRVMMERYGYDRLFVTSNAEELDRDQDAGGERRLMRIAMENDEDLVCVFVQCPSTGHKFALRVPPHITSCHQAVAWTAGFDDPSAYNPAQET